MVETELAWKNGEERKVLAINFDTQRNISTNYLDVLLGYSKIIPKCFSHDCLSYNSYDKTKILHLAFTYLFIHFAKEEYCEEYGCVKVHITAKRR